MKVNKNSQQLIKIDITKRAATLILANFRADTLSKGFFINSKIPKLKEIKEIIAGIQKFITDGNKFVKEIIKNKSVAKNPETAINLKPNP